MNTAFYERVLVEYDKTKDSKKQRMKGLDDQEVVEVLVLDWGTNRDGTPFEDNYPARYQKNKKAYVRADFMGINVGDNKWLIDRGFILGF